MTTDFFIGQSLKDIFLIVFSSFQMTLAGVEFHKTSQHTHVWVTDATSVSIWATLIRLSVIFLKEKEMIWKEDELVGLFIGENCFG